MTTETAVQATLRRFHHWSLLAFLLTFVVIILGAWTRLVDAGLGCPDWPGCYGFLTVPSGEENVRLAELRYPETPLDPGKGWPEMIHRYVAGILGLIVIGLAVAAVRVRHRVEMPVKHSVFTAGFIMLQAAFGAWTVTMQLWPQVVAAHLLGGFTTLTLLFLLFMRLSRIRVTGLVAGASQRLRRLRPWLYGVTALVVLQIGLGAWVAANYAALACPDLPTCQGEYWPDMDWAEGFNFFQSVGPNYLGGQLGSEGRMAIHKAHRVGAIVVTVALIAVLFLMARQARGSNLQKWVGIAFAALVGQMLLGIVNVLLHIPVSIAVLHNLGGALLLIAMVNLVYRLHHLPSSEDNRAPIR